MAEGRLGLEGFSRLYGAGENAFALCPDHRIIHLYLVGLEFLKLCVRS